MPVCIVCMSASVRSRCVKISEVVLTTSGTGAFEYLDTHGEENEHWDGAADGVLAAEDHEEDAFPEQAQELNPEPPRESFDVADACVWVGFSV